MNLAAPVIIEDPMSKGPSVQLTSALSNSPRHS
jgi:hypothetical protein